MPFDLFAIEDIKHFQSSLSIKSITVFTLNDFLSICIVESCKIFIIDIFDIDPLDFEIALKFQGMILPPERESLLMIPWFQTSHSFKHPTFYSTEK